MTKLKKILIASTVILTLTVPIAAKAFLPLAGIALLVEAAGGTVPFAISAATHAAIIGLITFAASDSTSPNQDLAAKPITVQIDPNTPLVTPPGWTNPTTPPQSIDAQLRCPDSQTSQQACSNAAAGCTFTETRTFTDAGNGKCARYVTISNVTFVPNPYGIQPSGPTLAGDDFDKISTCPTGYSSSSSNCNLTTPQLVKKPTKGKDEVKRVGNEFQRDPQQDATDNNPKLVQEAPNRISYTDNATGEKVTIELNSSTGAATVTHTVPNYGNSTTGQQTTNISSPSAGTTITGQSTATYPGIGDQTGSTPISGGTGSGTGDCAHCATEVTLSNLRDIAKDIKKSLDGEDADPELAGQGLAENLDALQSNAFTAMGQNMRDMVTNSGLAQLYTDRVLPMSPWHLATAGQVESCNFAFPFRDKVYNLSICDAQPFIHTALAFVFFILTAIGVMHIVAERPEGGN
ncbi:hypothetical protein LG201_13035 [Methylobacillus gramineus]|uniref:hypothetical protein n=1 Tax=Methylobacillus gramineus TaxID=755169 RepID=UPI001CFFA2DB|nr:hypothetical protein [Methylobacillus gramineus]MCB5186132.1 hypothetical protein [Methylobacillus gramineus]